MSSSSRGGGETDLPTLVASLRPRLLGGVFVFATLGPEDPTLAGAHATVREAEGLSAVLPLANAEAAGLDTGVRFRWITLEVHSSLEAVGLTAEVARRLADAGIAANVVAGRFHDHLLVPERRAAEAVDLLRPSQAT